jgi:hypothetical protein
MSAILFSTVVVGVVLGGAPGFGVQQAKAAAVSPAPVPAQIVNCKRVFISNGGDEGLNTGFGPVFSGRSDRVYSQFYAAVKEWGRYELVSAPADADVVFEISFAFSDTGLKVPQLGRLRLAMRDPNSNVPLWAFTEYVRVAILKGNRDKNFDQAMGVILDELKDLTQPGAAAKP